MKEQLKNKAKTTPTIEKKTFNFGLFKTPLFVLILIFCYLMFWRIGYPLIWNDESETIMTGQTILDHGYPKVHDGKNIIFLPEQKEWIGYDKDLDANFTIPWGSYYFAALAAWGAKGFEDIYVKTAAARIPFALIGMLGLMLMALSIQNIAGDKKYLFWSFFGLFLLLSVSLFLHLKQVRYYSLVIFHVGWIIYILSRRFISNNISQIRYWIIFTICIFSTYQTNLLVFGALSLVSGIFIFLYHLFSTEYPKINGALFKAVLLDYVPLILATLLVIPFLIFYKSFEIAALATEFYKATNEAYLSNIKRIWEYLTNLEFVWVFIFLKLVAVVFYFKPKNAKSSSQFKTYLFSLLMTILPLIFILVICKMPFLFVRHFIVLMPILAIGATVDLLFISQNLSQNKMAMSAIGFAIFGIFFLTSVKKIKYFREYLYEVSHQRLGPLDYAIPYIKEKYKNTKDLIVATNYEELSYVYYLDCKAVLGYNYKNLAQDSTTIPDVLIYRKKWGHDTQPFNQFMNKAKYEKKSFPVFDSPTNDITEIEWFFTQHLFRTKMATKPEDALEVYTKIN